MFNNDMFVNIEDLPQKLSANEVKELIERIQTGDEEAINILIEHNTRLVIHKVSTQFCFVDCEKSELVSVGMFGLVKAANTFDPTRNIEFSTYAGKCIDNEILMFLRKLKSFRKKNISLETPIGHQDDELNIKLIDTIEDDVNWFSECENKGTYEFINKILLDIPIRNRKIIMLYFGFGDGNRYAQRDIAKMLGLSQSIVSRIIVRELNYIERKLVENGFIEYNAKTGGRKYSLRRVHSKID